MKPLVSILIPAYNAAKWIAEAIKSALDQTWQCKEIIVVDDGSQDQTAEVARRFGSNIVAIVSIDHQGAAAARNHAFQLCHGEYIQWLDADDLLAPEKIELQLAAMLEHSDRRILLSGPWGSFGYRIRKAHFTPNSLWNDLSPVEWMLRSMGEHLHMQTATWLTSRELTEAAGPWDTRLLGDDDGEYFCRVLLASKRVRFVPEANVFYRQTGSSNRLSHIGKSDDKKDAMLTSMKLHIGYLRSLEDSERSTRACLKYLQSWCGCFYPERPDIVAELEELANQIHGHLEMPELRWKYVWMTPIFGRGTAQRAQRLLPQIKSVLLLNWDKMMYQLEKE